MVVLTAGAGFAVVYWWAVFGKIVVSLRRVPMLTRYARSVSGGERVCVVVPAHNEAGSIGALVRSVLAQEDVELRLVLALDRCTDGTRVAAEAAANGDERLEIVEIASCPDDWAGKVHAVHAAVTRSEAARSADLLVFVDADCELEPACLRAAAAAVGARGLDLLSLLPKLTTGRWFERVLQPAAGFELMRQYPLLRVNARGDRQRAFANGQFMMFRAGVYRDIGGHEAVKDELLEDIALARRIKEHGLAGGLLVAGPLLRCGMYESLEQFRRGWKRIYTEASGRKSDRLLRASGRARWLHGVLPAMVLAAGPAAAAALALGGTAWVGLAALTVGVAGAIAYLVGMGLFLWSGGTPAWFTPFGPFGSWCVASILRDAGRELATGVPTTWAGRSYVRVDRSQVDEPLGSAAVGVES